jgi:hypothetical protein
MPKKQKEAEYPMEWIKFGVDQFFGSEISPSGWRKWLRLIGVRPWKRTLSPQESIYLITYAHLRKKSPNKPIGLIAIKRHLQQIPYTPEMLAEQVEKGVFTPVTGRDMPTVIRQHTGKQVSLRTLYRWAEIHKLEFGVSKPMPKSEIQKWIDIASPDLQAA